MFFNLKRFYLLFLFFPLVLLSRSVLQDFIILNSEKIISCRVETLYKNTVVFSIQGKISSAALFAVKSIKIDGRSFVYINEKGFLYDLDSLNIYLAERNGTPIDKIPVSKPGTKTRKKLMNDENSKHELSYSVGAITIPQFIEVFDDMFFTFGTLGNAHIENYDRKQLLISYRYFSGNSYWSYGVDFCYEQFSSHIKDSDEKILDKMKTTYTSFAFATSYYWMQMDWFELYSGAGIGFMIIDNENSPFVEPKSSILPTFHLNLIGFNIGKKLYLLGEVGGGYRGMFTIGLACHF